MLQNTIKKISVFAFAIISAVSAVAQTYRVPNAHKSEHLDLIARQENIGNQISSKDTQAFLDNLFKDEAEPELDIYTEGWESKRVNAYVDAVREAIKEENAQLLIVAAQTEADIAELDTYEERQEFLNEIGLEESGVARLIRSAYALLNLQTFFTAGADEVRAWTFMRGSKAPQCAGIIHTDFEKGFIRAEVIKYDDYVGLGGEQGVKEAGKLGVEGKEYIVQDGDIMHFRFNV